MPVQATSIEGLYVIDWPTHADERGFFRQTYQTAELTEALGREPVFAQGNHSRSDSGVLRGFHAEPWDKLVYVACGTALCVIADIRPDSPTFARHERFLLGDEPGERRRLFITDGLANAFLALGPQPVDYLYDVSEPYRPGVDKRAVAWDDPDLAVDWPVAEPNLSPEDRANPTLRQRFGEHPALR